MQYLYLINCNDEFLKIGVAANLEDRLASLQTGNPYPLRVVSCYQFENAEIVERALHQTFKMFRGIGEWFKLSAADLERYYRLCRDLGGVPYNGGSGPSQADVEEAEEVQENLTNPEVSGKWDYAAMFADGWRMEKAHSRGQNNRYWCWRRGSSNVGREYIYGGTIASLPYPDLDQMRRVYDHEAFSA